MLGMISALICLQLRSGFEIGVGQPAQYYGVSGDLSGLPCLEVRGSPLWRRARLRVVRTANLQ